jgi:hypothetical protein
LDKVLQLLRKEGHRLRLKIKLYCHFIDKIIGYLTLTFYSICMAFFGLISDLPRREQTVTDIRKAGGKRS